LGKYTFVIHHQLFSAHPREPDVFTHNSPIDTARELIEPSNDAGNALVSI